MLACLEESSIPVAEVRALASRRSAGTRLSFRGGEVVVREASPDAFAGCDLALFSAGASVSGEWARRAVDAGAWVVDNSSRWRMDPEVPLVVPEVNPSAIGPEAPALIANPNCSTIQLVVALEPLRLRFGLRKVFVATYQSASGVGQKGIEALRGESPGRRGEAPVFPGRLAGNCLPQCSSFLEDGYTTEEEKLVRETQKILQLPDLMVHPACVRVPVEVCHSEAVYLETQWVCTVEDAREVLQAAAGVRLFDEPALSQFPTPLEAAGTDEVWVGRIRKDRFEPCGLHLWVVADNLRKGAALNAVQIGELLWARSRGGL